MALTFDLSMPSNKSIEFGQSMTFENFIGQFQNLCPHILYVVDGTLLRYYEPDDLQAIPKAIRFEYKQTHDTFSEYYFRDINTNQRYCVFNRQVAKIWYPRLDLVDPPPSSISTNQPSLSTSTNRPSLSTLINQPLSMVDPLKEMSSILEKKDINYSGMITIIDRGKKMVFPYHNYPVEIRTYKYDD
jgi:hypothetical protein